MLIGLLLSLSNPAAAGDHDHHDMDMHAVEGLEQGFAHKDLVVLATVPDLPASFSTNVAALQSDYLALTAAFLAQDSAAITQSAGSMRSKVEGMGSELEGEAARAWANHSEALRTGLHQIETAPDLASRRLHLSHVTEATYCTLKSFGAGAGLHLAFCPMANDNTGAHWLSSSKEMANPYFGEGMRGCGELRETLGS